MQHDAFIKKLSAYGVNGSVFEWLKCYLKNRICYVKSEGFISRPYYPSSGVLQGSMLSLLLFVLFINDITSVIQNSECLLYADDMKLYKVVREDRDGDHLQEDLNKICEWCDQWSLKVNGDKCNAISFSRKQTPQVRQYEIKGKPLIRVNEINDLGVTVTNLNGLSFDKFTKQ